jgi:hypothetical protein
MKPFEKHVICAPPRCSCPEIGIDHAIQKVYISDDYEGKVVLTFEELEILIAIYRRSQE